MSASSYQCISTVPTPSGKQPWTNCNNAPSTDGINCANPYDYTNWAYVKKVPVSPLPQDNTGGNILNNGDPYLGFVGQCAGGVGTSIPSYVSPFLQSQGVAAIPYVPLCGGPGSVTPNGCQTGSNVTQGCSWPGNPAGCISPWYARNWPQELASGPSVGPTTEIMMQCCSTPPNASDRTQTCPPDVWALSSKCLQPMTQGCTDVASMPTNNPNFSNLFGYCTSYLNQLAGTPDPVNTAAANNIVLQMLTSWQTAFASNGTVPSPSDPRVQFFIGWCQKNPGLCDAVLSRACSGVAVQDLTNDTTAALTKLCGCFLSPQQYTLPGIIPTECQSVCSNNANIGGVQNSLLQPSGNAAPSISPAVCRQSTCAINDVTLNYINNQTGNINFSQTCNGCPAGTNCTCVITDQTYNLIGGKNAGTVIAQNCQSCVYNGVQVPCSSLPGLSGGRVAITNDGKIVSTSISKEGYEPTETNYASPSSFFVILVIIVLIAIAYVIWRNM